MHRNSGRRASTEYQVSPLSRNATPRGEGGLGASAEDGWGETQTHASAASLAVADALTAPARPWRLLGVSTHTWWCALDEEVIVITDDRAARLPNAVLALDGFGAGASSMAAGEEIEIGDGTVGAGTTGWQIVRWWDPRVAPIPAEAAEVIRRVHAAGHSVSTGDEQAFSDALRTGDAEEAIARAAALVGRGRGLTPEGDDYLVGAIAGYRHVALSIDDGAAVGVVEATRHRLLATARSATTRLSFSLLRHAFRGDVAAPVGALLRALTGRGDLDTALADTRAIGGSSGPALASGVVGGAAAACGAQL